MLRIRDLSFSFREESVLQDLNIECIRGGFASLLGASGCGKSTLLRLVAGLKQPSAGQIHTNHGATSGTEPPQAGPPKLGFVFQKPTLCPWLSATKNVELALRLRGTPKSQRRADSRRALALVGLHPSDASKLPSQLSGGMRMRVSLARAFVTKPSLMLMDEPFSALDEVLRQQLCETTLRLWRQENWTTLFVTHNVSEAVFVSQRIYILAGKPATVVETIDVPFLERTPELRLAPAFLEFAAHVGRKLRAAVEATDVGNGFTHAKTMP